jgi:hypothetical protein
MPGFRRETKMAMKPVSEHADFYNGQRLLGNHKNASRLPVNGEGVDN